MSKKIIFIFLFLISCNKIPDSIGKKNDLIVVTSKDDKDYIFPYLYKIINKKINTPIEENVYNVKWIDAEDFFDNKLYKNIFIISLKQPADSTADILVEKISNSNDNKIFSIENVFANDQLLLVINAFDSIELNNLIKSNSEWIFNIINNKILDRFFSDSNSQNFNNEIINIIKNKFNLELSIDENYKVLKNYEDFLWIGRGYPYRWIMINYIDKITNTNNDIFDSFVNVIEKNTGNINISEYFNAIEYKTNYIKLTGLYEHLESDTGGPFIGYCYDDSILKDKYYCISGYVNNPGKSKYDLLKQLESIIINNRKVNDGI